VERPGGVAALPEGIPKNFHPQREADRLLLDRYSPPGVLVNSDMNILRFRGRTGHILEPAPGGASFNLLRMAREGLMIPLHTAIHDAGETGRAVRKENVLFKGNGDGYRVDLEVVPIAAPHMAQAARQQDANDARPEGPGGGAEQRIDGGPEAVLPWPRSQTKGTVT
jgi:hypothetical protein